MKEKAGMSLIEIRPARPEDREAVLAFSAHTWEWGDYIEYVWDEWLHDPQGMLFVATSDGQPVGIGHMRMLTKTEAWIEVLRVDPAFRGEGVASALYDAQLADAMRRGATIARLITESTNTAAIRILERGFMRLVAAYVPMHALPVTTPSKSTYGIETPTLPTTADIHDTLNYLNPPNIFPAAR